MAETVTELIQRRLNLRKELPDHAERRAIRVRAGLTQQEVADVIGTTRGAVSQWETGVRYPRGLLLDRYVEALNALRAPNAGQVGAPSRDVVTGQSAKPTKEN